MTASDYPADPTGHVGSGARVDPGSNPESPDPDPSEDSFDLLEAVRGDDDPEGTPPDLTLGGYMEEHDRPTAFEGVNGQPYTVDVDVEAVEGDDPDRAHAAFLVFVRWAETGAGILDHLESGDVAYGPTPEEARRAALELSLYEVKAELDAAIRRRQPEPEG